MDIKLSASQEDYLEAVLELVEGQGHAHVKDIAGRLGVKMPSVTGALHSLGERKMVYHRPYGSVTLTEQGLELARRVQKRHRLLTSFFERFLGLGGSDAEANACKIEHNVGEEVVDRLAAFMDFSDQCPAREQCTENGIMACCTRFLNWSPDASNEAPGLAAPVEVKQEAKGQ